MSDLANMALYEAEHCSEHIADLLRQLADRIKAQDAEIARLTAGAEDSSTTHLDTTAEDWAGMWNIANERANAAEAEAGRLRNELRTQRACNTSPTVLSAALALCSAADKARMFVECFDGADGMDGIGTFKLDIPADGYPRQWAVHAAPATLAELDAALTAVRKLTGEID